MPCQNQVRKLLILAMKQTALLLRTLKTPRVDLFGGRQELPRKKPSMMTLLRDKPAAALRCWLPLALGLALASCAAAPPAAGSGYPELAAQARSGAALAVGELRRAFLAQDDFDSRLRQLVRLEAEMELAADRPLRLGAIGSSALDLYYASLTAHRALAKFYRYVDNAEQAEKHEALLQGIADAIGQVDADGQGTAGNPIPVLTARQARAFLAERGLQTVGSTYHESADHAFLLAAAARGGDGPVRSIFFDLGGLYRRYKAAVADNPKIVFPVASGQEVTCGEIGQCASFGLSAFVHALARGRDTAAQTLIGRTLLSDPKHWEDAANWLWQAAEAGNAVADRSLAEACLALSQRQPEQRALWLERAENRYRRVADAGFDGAMVQLATLYRAQVFGSGKAALAVPLLERAGELGNAEALLTLGWMHVRGWEDGAVPSDHDLAESYFVRAAELDDAGNAGAGGAGTGAGTGKVEYARFLLNPETDKIFNARAFNWLREAAAADNPQAMLLIARAYHTGEYRGGSIRRARSWLKRAARTAPEDVSVVNEVAWTLSVTRIPRLRDARYALKIMERVMSAEGAENAARRNPIYLDTWAAAYAANGNFERAIAVQEEAVAIERSKSEARDLDVLLEHLAAFRAGEPISDEAVP